MLFLAVDLGSTNTKAALYDQQMRCLAMQSAPVDYIRKDGFVEFEPEAYVSRVFDLIRSVSSGNNGEKICITLTGQAESLLVLGDSGAPLMNAISWMDERSAEECAALERTFSREACYARTGQPAALPTWPATKILWLRAHRPDVFAAAAHYILLKDYMVFRLTGKLVSDRSIATFTYYFDIYEQSYWPGMLSFLGIRDAQLPPLAEPCVMVGALLSAVAARLGLSPDTLVNNGTLDHFCGMIGTGNIREGLLSLSTGTVLGLSTLAASPVRRDTGIPMHYGFQPDSYVMLSASESGGVSLDWYKNAFLPDVSYRDIDREAALRKPGDVLFLPYLVGSNGPEFDLDACGMFYGLRSRHDAYDLALAVMDGVCHLLRKNCDQLRASGAGIERIIATGGGAKSALWCQMQANITGLPVCLPAEKEAALLGAAMIGAVSSGRFSSLADAVAKTVRFSGEYSPAPQPGDERRHRQFLRLYDAMIQTQRMP
ncbi:Xylulose kinase [bioreactor metagenome]|uniref:Xylulose kinase n=1 Tax=bioreactor metagenome TaxID=1076179 RepID=A0A645A4W0_9ZZZZ|nr:FGGY family carbohydrate kinase [Christensenella sp.]